MFVQKSYTLKPADANKRWLLIDATDKIVGRLATEIADLLRGKNNPQYTPNTDSGDHVVVINAEKVKLTGNKWSDKKYYRHTGHIGGLKVRTAEEQLEKNPEQILMKAVKGMLPNNSLGRKQLTKFRVFVGEKHEHEAQAPEVYEF
ncbi:MAG: 50S ribosomal protein L13 [Bdellovibrionales bacterium]|jgi:large subunit ribosomal protein L13|nr:50S ribosomal protein L13 [Bdellovibrionales bacterium]MBT3525557.1 50S ribosomal protein L13 [Bdellovibrionales bacterium]MBT7668084.1 50S ribosomal protein L13 [Bdellovibrionales bacterium]MBT7767336.1 50S ribosomal protein L13 [Bdellovibrionales bacterium]